MSIRFSLATLVSFVLMTGAFGCTTNHGDFTVLSNKLVRTSEFELSKADRKKRVEGKDIARIILFIPTKQQVLMEEAIDDALDKGDGDLLTDANIKYSAWYIPLIYGEIKWVVTGDVVKTRRH